MYASNAGRQRKSRMRCRFTNHVTGAPWHAPIAEVNPPHLLEALSWRHERSWVPLPLVEGVRAGEFAVSVSSNWRLTFRFVDEDAIEVNLEDYH